MQVVLSFVAVKSVKFPWLSTSKVKTQSSPSIVKFICLLLGGKSGSDSGLRSTLELRMPIGVDVVVSVVSFVFMVSPVLSSMLCPASEPQFKIA